MYCGGYTLGCHVQWDVNHCRDLATVPLKGSHNICWRKLFFLSPEAVAFGDRAKIFLDLGLLEVIADMQHHNPLLFLLDNVEDAIAADRELSRLTFVAFAGFWEGSQSGFKLGSYFGYEGLRSFGVVQGNVTGNTLQIIDSLWRKPNLIVRHSH